MQAALTALPYTLIRSNKRKTLGLQVKKGEVIVRAPFFVEQGFIDDFVHQKRAWLQAKVEQQNAIAQQYSPYQLKDNGIILFLGEELRLCVIADKQTKVTATDQQLLCQLPAKFFDSQSGSLLHTAEPALSTLLNKFYQSQAKQTLPERVQYWQQMTELKANELAIRKYKARWGSCTSQGKISLNYLLMACPIFVIDYVIVHELCHLQHLNHSFAFWALVANHLPDYQVAKHWLKQNQAKIML